MMNTLKMWLLLFFMLYPGPSPVGGVWMMCTLNAISAENVTIPSVQHTKSEQVIQHLLWGPEMDAILLPRGSNLERHTHSGNKSTVYISARPCNCANSHPKITDVFYSPEPTNYCTIFKLVYGNEYLVSCTKYKGWKILFTQISWY
jgi:hypothetical protein